MHPTNAASVDDSSLAALGQVTRANQLMARSKVVKARVQGRTGTQGLSSAAGGLADHDLKMVRLESKMERMNNLSDHHSADSGARTAGRFALARLLKRLQMASRLHQERARSRVG